MTTDPLDLPAIKARAEAAAALAEQATEGDYTAEWAVDDSGGPGDNQWLWVWAGGRVVVANVPELIVARFIAAARTAVPQLAADVRTLAAALEAERAEMARLRAQLDTAMAFVPGHGEE